MNYYTNHNLAYDFALFEEQKKSPAVARGKKAEEKSVAADSKQKENNAPADKSRPEKKKGVSRLKRRKSNFIRIAAGVVLGLIVVVMIASIIHGQVQLHELNDEIQVAQEDLKDMKSRQTELAMQIAEAISTDEVDKYATETLHMSKATAAQKEYFSLREGDKAEVFLEEDKNIFERIIDAVSSLWS